MTNSKAFGKVLSRIRKEQGFPTAHQFFKNIGGSKSLGLAFMSYWDMERGKKLPKSWRLKAIMSALGIAQYSPKAQELIRAYFIALSGSDELIHGLSAPASAEVDLPSRELAEAATHRALAQLSIHLTLDQWKLCTRDLETDICQTFLNETVGWVTVRELADATRFKPTVVRKALKALASGGVVDLSGDKVRGKFVGKTIQLLPMTPATAGVRKALRDNCNKWLEGSKLISLKRLTVRMTKANLNIYRQHLENAVNLASIYGNPEENREDSAIYFIDARIYQFLPRD